MWHNDDVNSNTLAANLVPLPRRQLNYRVEAVSFSITSVLVIKGEWVNINCNNNKRYRSLLRYKVLKVDLINKNNDWSKILQ